MSFGTASTNNQQKTSVNDLNQGAKTGLDTSSAASGTGFDFLHAAGNLLKAPADYYHSILAGGNAADSALAPDINRTRMAADTTRNATETLAPRGGGRGSVLFNAPLQAGSQIQSIFNTARPMAAQGATQVGSTQGQIGNSTLGTGANYLSAGTDSAKYGFDAGTQQYKQQQQAGSAIGGMLGPLAGLAASFIPGIGPIIGPMLGNAIGKGAGAFGG